MILITDAHVSPGFCNVESFFEMLTAIEASGEDVVFLGDIFDLWVSLPRYEKELHRNFLAWCRRLKSSRTVGFIEGNHEFYMVRKHHDCFSWSSESEFRLGDHLFVHGDLINRNDKTYLRWRRLSKNVGMRTFVRVLPGGPRLVDRVKNKMKDTNKAYRMGLPQQELESYTVACSARGIRWVWVGHFHQAFEHCVTQGATLRVLPDWLKAGWITRIDLNTGSYTSGPWQTLLAAV